MIEETKFIKSILPESYTCEPRSNGVHCYSDKGIDEITEEHKWEEFKQKVKDKYGSRLNEFFAQVCTNHQKFTVYLSA